MPFLASYFSSTKVKASHKARVLLALCRHLRALHMVPVCGSFTGALGSICGGLSFQHGWWRAGQLITKNIHLVTTHASRPGSVHLLHCGQNVLWLSQWWLVKKSNQPTKQKRGSPSLNNSFIEEILQTISRDFPHKLGKPHWPWSVVKDPVMTGKATDIDSLLSLCATGKPLILVLLPGKNLYGPMLD